MRDRVKYALLLIAVICFAGSCGKDPYFDFEASGDGTGAYVTPARTVSPDVREVLIYVAGGYNSLAGYLWEDIEDLRNSSLPARRTSTDPILLVLSRLPVSTQDYTTPNPAVLFRLYADENGRAVSDTLRIWDENTPLFQTSTFRDALEFVNQSFPGNRYGLILSSHASGWLPYQYYYEPAKYESTYSYAPFHRSGAQAPWYNRWEEEFPPLVADDGMPAVKSVGMDDGSPIYEMELEEFAASIPMHMEYILFDACLMGCVEVAYELRNVTDLVGFSPTEVLAGGFNYSRLTRFLMQRKPDPVAVCKDYFDSYDSLSGGMRSATISVVDTRQIEALAQVCKPLFEKYRSALEVLPGKNVQGYFRQNRHFFYDLQDILIQSGITASESASLQQALDQCVIYKAATPSFLGISINTYSGLSMYLPSMGTPYLHNFYRSHVAWNKATSLVK